MSLAAEASCWPIFPLLKGDFHKNFPRLDLRAKRGECKK